MSCRGPSDGLAAGVPGHDSLEFIEFVHADWVRCPGRDCSRGVSVIYYIICSQPMASEYTFTIGQNRHAPAFLPGQIVNSRFGQAVRFFLQSKHYKAT